MLRSEIFVHWLGLVVAVSPVASRLGALRTQDVRSPADSGVTTDVQCSNFFRQKKSDVWFWYWCSACIAACAAVTGHAVVRPVSPLTGLVCSVCRQQWHCSCCCYVGAVSLYAARSVTQCLWLANSADVLFKPSLPELTAHACLPSYPTSHNLCNIGIIIAFYLHFQSCFICSIICILWL